MEIIYMIVIGGLAGYIASLIMKTNDSQGLFMDILVGIVGALVGGFVLGLFGFEAENFIGRLISATAGAVIFLAILKAVKK